MARKESGPPTVRFYQLAGMHPDQALARIAGKAHERGLIACLVAADPHRAGELDRFLWRFPPDGFLPHASVEDPEAERLPLVIGLQPDERNGATVAIMACPEPLAEPERFDLIIDFARGNDPVDLAASRERYRAYLDRGCAMEYWAQGHQGGWALQDKRGGEGA